MKNAVRFAHVPFDFISFYLFVLTFVMKLKDANYKSHWNNWVFCDQWKIMSDLNMSLGKMFDFVSFLLFGFTLVIYLRNFDFENHSNTLIFFEKKICGLRFAYVPWKNVWFCFISIAWVHFSHNKTEKSRFWNSMKYFNIFDKKIHDVQIWIFLSWKNVWFCLISIVLIHFSHKTEKFWFWKSLKYLINRMSDLNMSRQTVSDLV